MEFSKCNVIVTGGTRGIGRAITEAFLRNGAAVTAIYGSDDDCAARLKSQWVDSPLETVRIDVADYQEVERFFQAYHAAGKTLEVLVNNAGIRRDAVVGMMQESEWEQVLGINLTGCFNMSKFAVMKMMENRFGRIIMLTSPSGKLGFAGQANYAASKAGQVGFTKSLARETGRKGITVNCVSPGFIETDLIADLPENLRKEYREQVPLRRFGRPDEVADAVLFLARKESAYITGAVLEVTGGL